MASDEISPCPVIRSREAGQVTMLVLQERLNLWPGNWTFLSLNLCPNPPLFLSLHLPNQYVASPCSGPDPRAWSWEQDRQGSCPLVAPEQMIWQEAPSLRKNWGLRDVQEAGGQRWVRTERPARWLRRGEWGQQWGHGTGGGAGRNGATLWFVLYCKGLGKPLEASKQMAWLYFHDVIILRYNDNGLENLMGDHWSNLRWKDFNLSKVVAVEMEIAGGFEMYEYVMYRLGRSWWWARCR